MLVPTGFNAFIRRILESGNSAPSGQYWNTIYPPSGNLSSKIQSVDIHGRARGTLRQEQSLYNVNDSSAELERHEHGSVIHMVC